PAAAGAPPELLGQLGLAPVGVSGLADPLRLDEGVTFDAAPAEGADQAAEVVDQELRAHDLRGAADRPDDRRDGESAALPLELGHLRVDLAHRFSLYPRRKAPDAGSRRGRRTCLYTAGPPTARPRAMSAADLAVISFRPD